MANSKAKEFQIGDFVKVKPSGMIIEIVAVHQKKVGYHTVQKRLEWVRYDLLEPIPLTTEILEKTGFKRTEIYEKYEWYERHSEVWIIMGDPNDGEKLNVVHIDDWQHRIPVCYHNTIKYVHELQNALRLCRINKEITL